MSQGGYTLPDDVVEFEEKLPVEKRGSSLLEFFYDKSRDGKNRAFDPHKYVNDPEASKTFFCLPGKKTITWTVMERQGMSFTKVPVTKTKEIEVVGGNEGTQGHLAMAAGVGKTTKTINCITNGGKEHVVLVAPLLTLIESAVKHHTSWLPDWGCVFHKKSKTIKVLKGSLKPATEEEISQGLTEDAEVFASHGSYPVAKNELVYWVDDKGTFGGKELDQGKKGLSVLYYGILAGYCAREKLIKSGAIDEWQPDNTSEWSAEVLEKIRNDIKSKLLPKDTIFAFDEAHYNIGAYQALQLKMVQAGYKVIRMSATFPGVPFSTTSTYPKKSFYSGELDPKMPMGVMKIANEKHAEALAKFRGVKPETIKWQDENGQFLPVAVNQEERLRFGKTLIFVRDINITPEQDAVFGKKYSCIAFTPMYREFCETVSFGRQPGAIMLGNFEHQMGMTFEIDTVYSTGLIEVSNLGKNFTFSDKTTQFEPISSLIQEQGRVGRIQWGAWVTLTKEVQEIVVEEDVEAAMIKALFDGDITPIKDAEYPFFDIKMLWGGLAHPHRFGKPPSEALIGLKVDKNEKDRVKNKQPLTKIVWRTEADKGDLIQKGFFSSVIPDEALWERYLDDTPKAKNPETGKWEIIKMRADDSKELLKELIANFIAKDRNYPKGLNLRNQSNLIGAVYGDILKKGESEKDQVAKEVKNVLNGAIEKEIKKFIKDKVYDSNLQRSKDPKVIKDIVDLYQLNNSQVYFTFEENEEKEEVWTLNMKHNVIRT